MDSHNKPYPYSQANLHLFYKLRKTLPHNIFFYSTFYIIKYIPLYILTHNISNLEPPSLFTISHNLLAITFFGYGYKKYESSYQYIICFLFILLSLFIILVIFVRNQITKKINKNSKKSFRKRTIRKVSLIIFSICFTLISFFSQHLVEFNLLGIMNNCYTDLKIISHIKGITKTLVLIMNIANIIIVTLITQLFLIITSDFSLRHSLKEYKNVVFHNKFNLIIINGSLYGIISIFSYENELKGKEKMFKDYHLYLNIVTAGCLLIHIAKFISTFNFYNQNVVNKIRLFCSYLCFISSLDEIILKYAYNKNLSQNYSLCKLTLEIINALIFTNININLISSSHIRNLSKIFFRKKHTTNVNEILSYIELEYDYQKGKIPFDKIFAIFTHHKMNCNDKECSCKLMEITKLVNKEGNINIKVAKDYFSAIGQNEIKKSIYYFYKNNTKIDLLQIFVLFHIEHLFTIKKDYNIALYIASQYLSNKISEKFNFLTILYLYEYRYKIYHQITKLKRKKADFKETANEQLKLRQSILYRKRFLAYTHIIDAIYELLNNCCTILNKIIHFRQKAITRTNHSNKKYSNCENFISLCKQLHHQDDLLLYNIVSFDHKFKHYELSYLITYYYVLTCKNVPQQIKDKICHIDIRQKFDNEIYKKHRKNSYSNFQIENPLIVFLDKNDDFIIKYIANNLAGNLQYSTKELISQSISELIPHNIRIFHKMLMKKYVLFKNEKFVKSTFVLDKENYLIKTKIIAFPIPTIENNIGIIFSFHLLNDQNNEDIENNNNNNEHKISLARTDSIKKQKLQIEYNIILDNDFNFICINKNFANEFFFNFNMLNFLKMNYCSFFGIFPEKLRTAFKHQFKKQRQNYSSSPFNCDINSTEIYEYLEHDKRYYKIFSLGNQNLMFKNINNSSLNEMSIPKYKISTFLSKRSIIKNIQNVIKTINEIGLDIEWFTRINCLRERLLINGSSLGFKTIYTFVPLERMSYIIVTLIEKLNPIVHQTKMEGFHLSILNANSLSSKIENNCHSNIYKATNAISSPVLQPHFGKYKMFPKKTIAGLEKNEDHNEIMLTKTHSYIQRGNVNFSSIPIRKEGAHFSNKKYKKKESMKKVAFKHNKEQINKLTSMYNAMYENLSDKSSNRIEIVVTPPPLNNKNIKDNTNISTPNTVDMFIKKNFSMRSKHSASNEKSNKSKSNKSSSSVPFILGNKSSHHNTNILIHTGLNSSLNSSKQILIKTPQSPSPESNITPSNFITFDPLFYVKSLHIKPGNYFKIQNISKYFYISSYFLFILLVCLSLFSFVFNRTLMTLSKGLFNVNIYSLLIKSDIFFGSLSILTSCENAYYNRTTELIGSVDRLGFRGKELMSDYSNLMKTLNSINNINLQRIFDILNTKSIYHNLHSKFIVSPKESTFHEEILLFHYFVINMYQQEIPFQQCRLPLIFKNRNLFKDNIKQQLNESINQSLEEEAMYYIVKNVVPIFKRNLEELTRSTNDAFIEYIKESKNKIMLYNSTISVIALILLMLILFLLFNYKQQIRILISVIYTDRENEVIINRGMNMILELIANFTIDKYNDFEKRKEMILNEITSNEKSSVIKTVMNNDKTITQLKGKRKIRKTTLNFTRKNTNIFNTSKPKLPIVYDIQDKDPFENITGLSQDKTTLYLNKENSNVLISLYPNKLTNPSLITYSFYIILISITLFILIDILSLVIISNQYDDLYFMHLISINFIDRLQKLCELEIYAKISILLNDPYYLITEQSSYDSLIYSNYYNISFDINNNYIFDLLGNSEFSFLYYQSLQITENINQYIQNKKSTHLLESTLFLHKLLEKDYGVCIYGAIGFVTHNTTEHKSITLIDELKKINNIVSNCKMIGNGMTLNPLNELIELILSEMVNVYCDFVNTPSDKRDYEKFLTSYILEVSNLIITDPIKKVQNTIILTELNDIDKIFNNNRTIGIIFSIVLIIDLFISICIIDCYLIKEIKQKIKVLRFTNKIFSLK